MLKKLFPLLLVTLALTPAVFSQNTGFQAPVAVKLGEAEDIEEIFRPRRVPEKESDVAAAVVVNTRSVERIAFEMINSTRVEMGLSPLTWNEDIASVAREHSQNMAEFRFFSHRGLDNKMVSDRADAKGVRKWRAIGENIAYNRGYQDPVAKAVQLWLNSSSHKSNMLDPNWRESAVGVAIASDGSYYFTQVFLVKR
ncbi:MAG: CAP domain-containing protein [Acidobacteriota bacterium]|nr:MAG: CAP domain-containing protein [Acidobacteriota bacterium]